MEYLYSIYNNVNEKVIFEIYEYIYEYFYMFANYGFNYCPAFYQMIYFYFPILFIILKKFKFNKDDLENKYFDNSINYLYIHLKFFLLKIININFFLSQIKIFFLKIFFFFKTMFLKTIYVHICIFKAYFFKNIIWVTWKPIFKRVSYLGIFSYIRTKWYKNK